MTLSFNAKQLSLYGVLLILTLSFGNRILFLFRSKQATGKYTTTYAWGYQDMYKSPVINYKTAEGSDVIFLAETNIPIADENNVPVIYKTNNPENAYVFTFFGFWYMPLIHSLIPLAIYFAFVMSFVNSKQGLTIRFHQRRVLQNPNRPEFISASPETKCYQ